MYKYALLFPGQSISQKNILSSFFIKNKIVQNVFYESSDYVGYNLLKLITHDPKEKLKKNKYSQLFTMISSIAIYKLWKNKQKQHPTLIAGHSLGEYTALVCSKSLRLYDAIKLIIIRHRLMKEAMSEKKGLMTIIIGLSQSSIKKILKNYDTLNEVSIACINTSHQIVISGEKNSVTKISLYCKKLGAKKIINLPIHPPSHCILMKQVAKKLLTILKQIKFNIPIYSVMNSTSLTHYDSEESIRNALAKQLYSPIRWNSIIKYIKKNVTFFIEVSTKKTLTNLNKNIVGTSSISLNDQTNFLKAVNFFS